jgi:hypothetical protein
MIVLAVLQNMWVNDPEKVRRILERTPQARRRMIAYSLFAGCRTGRVLKQVFGEDCPRRFVWDESTREIAGNPREVFPADLSHLRAVLEELKPDVVLAFGRIASDALTGLVPTDKLLIGPHPTARQPNTMTRLHSMAEALKQRGTDRPSDMPRDGDGG